jgi:alpha-1,3-rhamnosyltransferase
MGHELRNVNYKNHVTVVMPCYNHAQYIERAVLSVVRQSYRNIDLVVIDDGSKDESVHKLKELQKHHGFTLITQENKGVCKTLNKAIREAATGEYIALLASDDFWHEDKLRLQVESLWQHPESEFCFSQAIEFTDETNPSNGRLFPKKCLSGQVLNSVFLRQHVPAGTMLFSRRLYDQLGGFDENLKEEDWDFVIRSAAATSFCSVNKPLLHYRSHATNTMRTRNRAVIFQQKIIILSKNFNLVSPFRWLLSVLVHFTYDIILKTKWS